ncbi:MAG: hypothetical protein IJG60_09120 [Thermoguttaceae bacterium]|nr:hypothetical protein [Thermoguttaceae bacterium]
MRYRLFLLLLACAVACGAGPTGPMGGRLAPRNYNNPQLFPGVNGPGPGVIAARGGIGRENAGGATAQILFQGPDGMNVNWDVSTIGAFDSEPIITEGIQDFETGKEYRLRLSNLPNRKGVGGAPLNLYPTLQVNSVTPRTRSYLEHNAIPVRITDNDIDQVQAGNFVTKVIFLPAPEFQNIAVAGGVDTIVNTQLPAGTDPVVEAQNRGSILAVVQIGNKDLGRGIYPAGGYSSANDGGNGVPQVPISGVNVPNFGTPNSVTPYGVPGPPVLPAAPEGVGTEPLISPINPMPATDVPQAENSWSGINF